MTSKFWKPFVWSLVLTLPTLFVALSSATGYSGTLMPLAILFPYVVFLRFAVDLDNANALLFLLAALIQFPAYGFFLGRANEAGVFQRRLLHILIVHVLVAAVAVLIVVVASWGFQGSL